MPKRGCYLVIALALAACQREPVPVPPFTVAVELDPEATSAILSLNEDMIASVVLDGDGEANLPHPEPYRSVLLGIADREVGPNGVARFSGLTVWADDLQRLDDPDYFVSVNVSSARRSGPDNILSCAYAEGRISKVKLTGLHINCSLIR